MGYRALLSGQCLYSDRSRSQVEDRPVGLAPTDGGVPATCRSRRHCCQYEPSWEIWCVVSEFILDNIYLFQLYAYALSFCLICNIIDNN